MEDTIAVILEFIFLKIIFPILCIGGLIIFCIIGYFTIEHLIHFKDYEQKSQEWKNKVQQCVINRNYRKDCEYIIYVDSKNRAESNTVVYPVPIYVGR